MSSSRSKNFRRRSDNNDANGDDKPSPTAATSTSTSTIKNQTRTLAKPRNPKPEGPKRLSFADDEEEDEGPTTLRRPTRTAATAPSAMHKLTSAKDRSLASSTAPPIPSIFQPQAGEYTKERLRELQKNARPLGSIPKAQLSPSFSDAKPQKPDPPAEPVIVLKGLVKPMPEKEKAAVPKVEEEVDEDEERSDVENRRFAKLGIDRKAKDLSGIPDQATIDAIRAKKERIRQSRGPAPDYISLDGGGVIGSRPSADGSSDEEDHDFRGRIALFGDKADGGKTKKGVFEDIDERVSAAEAKFVDGGVFGGVGDDDDEDEEERKWEEEQFRKGLGKRIESVDEASTHKVTNTTQAQVQLPPAIYPGIAHQSAANNLSLGEGMSIPQKAEIATRALKENISKLKETHSRTLTSLLRTDETLSEALSDITTLEKSLEAAGEKYVFMQQLRDFISITCDFLKDKALLIEELEEEMQKLHEKRAAAVEERRAADTADETGEVEAAVSAAMSVLNKGSGQAFISAATSAAQVALAAVRESSNLPVQLDEYSRDINLQKRMDFTRRAEARKRRRARSESKRTSLSSIGRDNEGRQTEGEVTTDESDSESSAYQSTRDELLQTADQIFSDAADEYSNLSIVKQRFERWKKQYHSSYRDAYMSLSAPAVFSPYVRLELLKWDPLYNMTDFYDMEWHKLLFDYGMLGEDRDFDPDDADANLIPELVEKVALPILHHEIEHCWDMFSTRRTENAVYATNLVVSYVPASSKALQELLSVVCSRLTQAIASLSVPVWTTVVTRVVPGAAQFAAYRFGTSVRLLRNVCLWKDILSLPVLEKLALEELLIGKLLPHVRSIMSNIHDAITRTERIVASLSGVWYGPKVTADHSQKLQPLVDCMAELGRKLEKRQASGVSEEETLGLARRLKAMLVQLNEYDKAKAILRTFHLKEAL